MVIKRKIVVNRNFLKTIGIYFAKLDKNIKVYYACFKKYI